MPVNSHVVNIHTFISYLCIYGNVVSIFVSGTYMVITCEVDAAVFLCFGTNLTNVTFICSV